MTARARVCAVVVAAALGLTSVAGAAPAREPRAQKAARAHFQRAEKAFNLGRFDEALAAYEAAFDALALPGFLFNIAQCHRNLGNHERALFFYRRFISVDPETSNRALVEELIAEEEQALAEKARAAKAKAAAEAAAEDDEAARPAASLAPAPPKTPSPLVETPEQRGDVERFVRQNWMWLGIGAVVVAGVATAIVAGGGAAAPPPGGKLGKWDLR